MKNVLKQALLAVLLLASGSLWAAESGKCGDFITWTLDDAGNLKLTGRGPMFDYGSGISALAPWYSSHEKIKSVTISNGITRIGDWSFYQCSSLESVAIPNSVESIGQWSFCCCDNLSSVEVPGSVTVIESCAFSRCKGLVSINLSNTLTAIEDSTFGDCSNLESIEIPYGVKSIGDYAFLRCSSLARVNIPNSVTSIGKLSFDGCGNLLDIKIPDSVTSIDYGAFENCSGLTSIELPSNLAVIEDAVFSGCSNLESIWIPSDVTSIGTAAFWDCRRLEDIELPNKLMTIGYGAFEDCANFKSIVIPSSVTSIGEGAFANCPGIESMTVGKNNPTYDSRNNCNAIIETKTNTLVSGCKNTVVPNRVEKIADSAFFGSGLTRIDISHVVTSIGDRAFTGCADLKTVTIGANVESVGGRAFVYCPKLESIVVDEANPMYDSRDNCNAIIETKTNTLFLGCKGSVIPSSVVCIGDDAFEGSGLMSVVIPESVTSIRDYAFHDCTDLESVTLGANVEFVGEHSFTDCEGLKRFELLSTVPPRAKNFFHDSFDDVDVFDDDAYYTCQLIVPDEAIDAYRRTAPWAYFDHIAGVEDVIADGGVVVTADGGNIIVNGADSDAEVEVYGASGALIYRGASHSVAVPAAGIYVVRVAGKAVKVALTL